MRQGGPLRVERPELLHPPARGGRVVAALAHDPLAALAVHFGIADPHPLHRPETVAEPSRACIHPSYFAGKQKGRCLATPALTCTFVVGLGRFELPTS